MDTYASNLLDESYFPYNHAELIGSPADGYPYAAEIGTLADGNRYGVEIGTAADGLPFRVEIGEAIRRVLTKARDNRQPAPTMRAVDVDAPPRDEGEEWLLTDVFLGAAVETGEPNPFPLTAALLQRFGAGGEPRIVQVDTERSYRRLRAQSSPEMRELLARMADLEARFARHAADPGAHEQLAREAEAVDLLGAAVKDAEAQKQVAMWLPQRFEGTWTAWLEGDQVCASIRVRDRGQSRVLTSLEPAEKGIAEMARHASEAGVPAAAITPLLPAMGVVLGAANVAKDLAAGGRAIFQRPEIQRPEPFVVRIEPKAAPALCALAALAQMCQRGDAAACDEWQRLSATGGPAVRQAMGEGLALLKSTGAARA